MDENRLVEMEQRMQFLEGEVRRLRVERRTQLKLAVFLLLLIATCTVGWGLITGTPAAAQPTIVRVNSMEAPFEVQGKGKKTILRVEESPVPALWLFGDGGKSVKLVITDNGGGVSIRAASTTSPTFMGYDANGSGMIVCADKDGKRAADLSNEGVQVYHDGRVVGRIGTSGKGDGILLIGNTNGDTVVDAGVLDGRGIVRAYPYSPRTGEILRGSNFIVGAKK